ncbi:hypothetical protein C8J57DRAFT_18852 [Mycena rebaudengoi]|nr:hypothetical protein C8J57DRAFT_18852 [Mycena rebaudengoi]
MRVRPHPLRLPKEKRAAKSMKTNVGETLPPRVSWQFTIPLAWLKVRLSARFRIKKKQRTLALERSVSDLTGRAEDLEREASDLRRENGWLKEIVMLKGGRLSGVNFSGMNLGYPEQSGRSGGQPGSKKSEEEADQADDSEESEEEKSTSGKKKGKGKSKKK